MVGRACKKMLCSEGSSAISPALVPIQVVSSCLRLRRLLCGSGSALPSARFFSPGYAHLSRSGGQSPRGRGRLPREIEDLAHSRRRSRKTLVLKPIQPMAQVSLSFCPVVPNLSSSCYFVSFRGREILVLKSHSGESVCEENSE